MRTILAMDDEAYTYKIGLCRGVVLDVMRLQTLSQVCRDKNVIFLCSERFNLDQNASERPICKLWRIE
jgi:hypothetical protein